MKPGQPLPPPALPSAGLAGAVTLALRSRWPSRAGRPRSPEAREAPGPRCALVASRSAFWKGCPTTAAPSPEPPFGSSLVFPEAPPPPRRTDEERGDSGWHRLAPRCTPGSVRSARGQLRPCVTCRLRAAAAGTLPKRHARLRTATPAPGAPCARS